MKDFDSDFGSLWNKFGEYAKSLILGLIPSLIISRILNFCHNLEVVDLQLASFEGN